MIFTKKIGQSLVSSFLSTASIISAEGNLPRLDLFSNLTMTALTLKGILLLRIRDCVMLSRSLNESWVFRCVIPVA